MYFLVSLVERIFELYYLLLLARILISWFPALDRYHPIVQFIYNTTEPVMAPFRNLIPPIGGTIDISPIILFIIVLPLAKTVIIKTLLIIGSFF